MPRDSAGPPSSLQDTSPDTRARDANTAKINGASSLKITPQKQRPMQHEQPLALASLPQLNAPLCAPRAPKMIPRAPKCVTRIDAMDMPRRRGETTVTEMSSGVRARYDHTLRRAFQIRSLPCPLVRCSLGLVNLPLWLNASTKRPSDFIQQISHRSTRPTPAAKVARPI